MKLLYWLVLGLILGSAGSAGAQTPIAAARFDITIDGYSVSAKAVDGGGSPTDEVSASSTPVQVTIDGTGSQPLWAWISESLAKGPVKKTVEAQAKGKRRAQFQNAVITEVTFPKLEAKDGKKHMEMSVTFVPEKIVAKKAAIKGAAKAKQKGFQPSNFRVSIGGLPVAGVRKIDSFTIKLKPVESAVQGLGLTLDAAAATKFASSLAKGKNELSIELTNADGSVYKTLRLSGVKARTGKSTSSKRNITLEAKKILIH